MTMRFEIRRLSWYKRRPPTEEPQPVRVEIPDIKLEAEHKCDMYVTYDNGDTLTLSGRVEFNDIKKKWSICGIDPHGHQCLADIIE